MQRTLLLFALLAVPRLLSAQGVLVAPHYLVMDHRTRSGTVTVYNPGNDPTTSLTVASAVALPASVTR